MNDIFVIVPYLEQRKLYLKIKPSKSEWSALQIVTSNKAQCFESSIVFFDSTVAENLGGKIGFVADKHRLAAYTTRHKHTLVVVIDKNAILQPKGKKSKKEIVELTEGAEVMESDVRHDLEALEGMVDWVVKENRMIEEDVSSIDDHFIAQITSENYDTKAEAVNPHRLLKSGATHGF